MIYHEGDSPGSFLSKVKHEPAEVTGGESLLAQIDYTPMEKDLSLQQKEQQFFLESYNRVTSEENWWAVDNGHLLEQIQGKLKNQAPENVPVKTVEKLHEIKEETPEDIEVPCNEERKNNVGTVELESIEAIADSPGQERILAQHYCDHRKGGAECLEGFHDTSDILSVKAVKTYSVKRRLETAGAEDPDNIVRVEEQSNDNDIDANLVININPFLLSVGPNAEKTCSEKKKKKTKDFQSLPWVKGTKEYVSDPEDCPICRRPIAESTLLAHLKLEGHTRHFEQSVIFKCGLCHGAGSFYRTLEAVRAHVRLDHKMVKWDASTASCENRFYVCPVCSVTEFVNLCAARNHVLAAHSSRKDFLCDTCGEGFACKMLWSRHKSVGVGCRRRTLMLNSEKGSY